MLSISTIMTMLLMMDFVDYHFFFILLHTPVKSVAGINHARVFGGYFCSISADSLTGSVVGEKSFFMRR